MPCPCLERDTPIATIFHENLVHRPNRVGLARVVDVDGFRRATDRAGNNVVLRYEDLVHDPVGVVGKGLHGFSLNGGPVSKPLRCFRIFHFELKFLPRGPIT
jgi:hypothetical protein